MRDILFRGKRTDNGNWVQGSVFIRINDVYIIPLPIITSKSKVDPTTVGQYTGLTDINGKKIFEGDIVESHFTRKPYQVCYGEFSYTDEYGDNQEAYGWYNTEKDGYATAFANPSGWATIIGNIHDNPELLGGAE